jgi:hypothetical protein
MEGNWQATEVGLQVNLGRGTATRAGKRLIMLPPFCARCRDMAAHHGGIEHLHHMRRLAHCRQGVEECFESSRSAQPPEPLPHAVPVPEFLRKSPLEFANQLASLYGQCVKIVEPYIYALPCIIREQGAALTDLDEATRICESSNCPRRPRRVQDDSVTERRQLAVIDTRGIWQDMLRGN